MNEYNTIDSTKRTSRLHWSVITERLQNIKNNNRLDDIYYLEMDLYYYNINCKYNNKWFQPKILNYASYVKYNNPHEIFRLLYVKIIKNGGWHLSYFGNIEFIKNKIRNFLHHEEYNNDFILNDDRIQKQMQNGDDLFGRPNETLHYIDVKDNLYLPHKYEDFKELLNKK